MKKNKLTNKSLLQNRLHASDQFYVDLKFELSPLPKIIRVNNKLYYRYLDRIFCPKPINSLTLNESRTLCEIRIDFFDNIVNDEYNEKVMNCIIQQLNLFTSINKNSILDFGCGNGKYTSVLKKYYSESSIYGIDISEKSIKKAKQYDNSINWQFIDETQIFPFNDNSVDVIISTFVMHFDIDQVIVKELYRVLKPSGVFLFNIFNKSYLKDDLYTKMKEAGFLLDIIDNCELSKNNINISAIKARN